tara:strand:+ start:89 stop:268 length:180 start_codon:yes stop_codon:yes gene_type:complete
LTESGPYDGVVLLDVKRRHAVFNNEHTRIGLQIMFDESADDTLINIIKNGDLYEERNYS